MIISVMLIFSFAACTSTEKSHSDESFCVVTSFYPVYVAASNIMHNAHDATLVNLTAQHSGCLHDYSLSTENLKTISDADLFIVSGLGMESFIEKAAMNLSSDLILDCSKGIKTIENDNGEINPHYWMDIDNSIAQCITISEKLCEINPQNAQIYEKNTKEYIEKLNALREDANSRLSDLSSRDIIVFHDSFDYFAESVGINIIPVLSNHDGSVPSAKKLGETVELMREKNISALFVEKNSESDAAEIVSEETGAEIYVLDCVTAARGEGRIEDAYINAITDNIEILERVLK